MDTTGLPFGKPVSPPPAKPGKGVKRVNRKRKAKNFARAYGSELRVMYVQGLPCAACGHIGHSENAHIRSKSGAGRKGDASTVIPLCSPRLLTKSMDGKRYSWMIEGCHRDYDRSPSILPNAQEVAEETERSWQAFSASTSHISEREGRAT